MQEANLWDVSDAPTIVATQRGARLDFQARLRAKGVEVLEFDFLTPDAVARWAQRSAEQSSAAQGLGSSWQGRRL